MRRSSVRSFANMNRPASHATFIEKQKARWTAKCYNYFTMPPEIIVPKDPKNEVCYKFVLKEYVALSYIFSRFQHFIQQTVGIFHTSKIQRLDE